MSVTAAIRAMYFIKILPSLPNCVPKIFYSQIIRTFCSVDFKLNMFFEEMQIKDKNTTSQN